MIESGPNPPGEDRLPDEALVATRLRQFFRAVAARDQPAITDTIDWVVCSLRVFLEFLLINEPSWPSERWIDDLIKAQYDWATFNRLRVSGEMVWGLTSDIPGAQWSEPFFADVAIAEGRVNMASYCIRFGRKEDINKAELPFGFYPSNVASTDSIADPWAGKADWKYEFRKPDAR